MFILVLGFIFGGGEEAFYVPRVKLAFSFVEFRIYLMFRVGWVCNDNHGMFKAYRQLVSSVNDIKAQCVSFFFECEYIMLLPMT